MSSSTRRGIGVLSMAVLTALTACSVGGDTGGSDGSGDSADVSTVTLVTHDSWAMPDAIIEEFETASGYTLEVLPSGDAGAVTNKLTLTRDNPIGDAVFGIDNTFATRAVGEGVLEPYTPERLPSSARRFALPDADDQQVLTPVDWGDVCVNVDDRWFADAGLTPPRTLDDLTKPAYQDLLVTPAASTSSPGFAFLLATIGEYGEDGWQDYWTDLMENGARVVSDWSEAYEVDFTAGGGNGDRPLVVSYNSSPPFTIPEGGKRPTTSALLDTCFRQVEYAGVLSGTDNPEGAQALVDFMVGRSFQEALPENMYVFPVDDDAELPALWSRWAKPAPDPREVDPEDVTRSRSAWIQEWRDLTSR
jgi:thiamine transport system substrate-binding protein